MKTFTVVINWFVPLVVGFYFGCNYRGDCQIEISNSTLAGATNSIERSITSIIEVRPNGTEVAIGSFANRGDKSTVETTVLVRAGASLRCFVGVMSRTNLVAYKPLPSQAYEAGLFDEAGRSIPKTSEGRKTFGKPLKVDDELRDAIHHRILNQLRDERTLDLNVGDGDPGIWDFYILKSFRVTQAGRYRLQVQARLFVKDTNGRFQPLLLAPVETQLTIREQDLPRRSPGQTSVYWSFVGGVCVALAIWVWRRSRALVKPT